MTEDSARLKRKQWAQWLQNELARRDWRPVDLIRASNEQLTSSVVTRWVNGTFLPDIDKARAVADALGLPVVQVLIAAGHLTRDEANVTVVVQESTPDDFTDEELLRVIAQRLEIARLIRDGKITYREERTLRDPRRAGQSEGGEQALLMEAARRRKRRTTSSNDDPAE